ncbi:hypothetical protein BH11MYX4_BH11MYX4_53930 [soil metagenome]
MTQGSARPGTPRRPRFPRILRRKTLDRPIGHDLDRAALASGPSRTASAGKFRDLDQPEVAGALEQALHGDLRYAQALYSRSLQDAKQPVTFDFDMMRASMSSSRSFGADIFGISVYHRVAVEKTGSFAVQTPDGVQSVLWNSFEKSGGWFQMDHGSKLTAISSASLNAGSPDKAINRANLVVQSVVGDKHMDDDVLLDSTDALIVTLAGTEALAPLDKYGSPMQEAVGRECPVTKAAPPASHLEVGLDLAANVKSSFWAKRERFIKAGFQAVGKSARGSDVEPIASKLFDMDKMMGAR